MLLNKHNLWDPPPPAIRLITLQGRGGHWYVHVQCCPPSKSASGSCHSPTTPLFSVWWRIYPTTPGVYRLGITDFHSIPSPPPPNFLLFNFRALISSYILPSPSWSGCFVFFCLLFFLTRVMCLPFTSFSFVPLWGLQEHHFSDSFFLAYACFGIVSISVVWLLPLPGRR